MIFLDAAAAMEYFPCQIKYVYRSGNQHGRFDFGNQAGQRIAEHGTQQHYNKKARAYAKIEGQGFPKSPASPVGHRHDIVRPGRSCRNDCIDKKRKPVKHGGLPLRFLYNLKLYADAAWAVIHYEGDKGMMKGFPLHWQPLSWRMLQQILYHVSFTYDYIIKTGRRIGDTAVQYIGPALFMRRG